MSAPLGLVTWVEFQNQLEQIQNQLNTLTANQTTPVTTGTGSVVPIPPWPTTEDYEIGKPAVGLEISYPVGTQTLTCKLEEYTQTGVGGSTINVIRTFPGVMPLDDAAANSGESVQSFPERLAYNSLFGCIQLIADFGNGTRVKNPASIPVQPPKLT